MIVFAGLPPRLAAPRLVQEAQEPAQAPRHSQPRVLRRPGHRRPQEIPVQVDVILRRRRDEECQPVRHVLRIEPGIKIISRPAGLRGIRQQVRRAVHPAFREDHPPSISHAEQP